MAAQAAAAFGEDISRMLTTWLARTRPDPYLAETLAILAPRSAKVNQLFSMPLVAPR